MKTLLISIVSLVLGLASLNASAATQLYPSVGGGYNAYHSNGSTTTIRPSVGGGYNAYHSNGSTTTIRPSVGGGFIID